MDLIYEFTPLSQGLRLNRQRGKGPKGKEEVEVIAAPPFEPTGIHKILNSRGSNSFKVEGRQEDAEEFLSYLLNGIDDEMLEVRSENNGLLLCINIYVTWSQQIFPIVLWVWPRNGVTIVPRFSSRMITILMEILALHLWQSKFRFCGNWAPIHCFSGSVRWSCRNSFTRELINRQIIPVGPS